MGDGMSDEGPTVHLNVVFEKEGEKEGRLHLGLASDGLFGLYKSLKTSTPQTVIEIIWFAKIINETVGKMLVVQGAIEPEIEKAFTQASEQVYEYLLPTFERISEQLGIEIPDQDEQHKPEPQDEQRVIEYTYNLLKMKTITRAEAAGIAQRLLLRDDISVDSWRLKVDRWAKRTEGKDPVGIRKRKK